MANQDDIEIRDETILTLAVGEYFPDTTYGAMPLADQQAALEAFLAYDEGVFDEAPQALAAFLSHQKSIEV